MNQLIEHDDNLKPETISPVGLQVIDAYLMHDQDASKAATALSIPEQEVRRILKTTEVRNYLNHVFLETGFRNRNRMFGVLDEIINRKLEEMEESGVTTDADILEIMKVYHKMKMDEMKMERELLEAKKAAAPVSQKNTQINIAAGGEAYHNLLSTLMQAGEK